MKHWLLALVLLVGAAVFIAVGARLGLAEGPDRGSSARTQAAVTSFNYQGNINQGGSPLNGTADFQFSLWDAQTGGNRIGATQTVVNATVTNGAFSVEVNAGGEFGANAFDGSARWLEVAVKSPSGSAEGYTTLSPRQPLTRVPYALYSETALWSGLIGVPAGFADAQDNDTTYTAGGGLAQSGNEFQVRFAGSGSGLGSADAVARSDHDHDARYVEQNEANSVTSGMIVDRSIWGTDIGIGAITSNEILAYGLQINRLNTSGCQNEQIMRANTDWGRWECVDQVPSAVTATVATTATYATAATAAISATYATTATYASSAGGLQGRPIASTAPTSGQALKWDGSQWAPADDATGGGGSGADWSLTGNAGTSASNFLGTTDNQSLDLKVNSARALRLEPNGMSPNVIGGYSGNNVSFGQVGATIGGGGSASGANAVGRSYATVGGGQGNNASGEKSFIGGGANNHAEGTSSVVAGGQDNGVSSSYATVGGGYFNQASQMYATVGGGSDNIATGSASAIAGGSTNQASGYSSAIGGGYGNTASGSYSGIGGGYSNAARAYASAVGGGYGNVVSGTYGTVAGGGPPDPNMPGTSNRVTDNYGAIGGGGNNQVGDSDANTADAIFATVSGGITNTASASYAAIGGGQRNTASGANSAIGGGYANTITGTHGTIGGGESNGVGGPSGTVAGGSNNWTAGSAATVGGGFNNSASVNNSTVAGGVGNVASGGSSAIGGGGNNQASGGAGAIAGGWVNRAEGDYSAIAGGYGNVVSGTYGTIAGGGRSDPKIATTNNRVTDDYGFIGGGANNQVGNGSFDTADAIYATVAGGITNTASASYSAIGGGSDNAVSSAYATIAGGSGNVVSGTYGTIAGGGRSSPANAATSNRVTDNYGFIGGGGDNQAGDDDADTADAAYATVSGGHGNEASAAYSAIGGGFVNRAQGIESVVAGGSNNLAEGDYGTIAGGLNNLVRDTSGTVAGGDENRAYGHHGAIGGGKLNNANGPNSAIAGGWGNATGGDESVIAGGWYNRADGDRSAIAGGNENEASGDYSAIGGGHNNVTTDAYATIPGGRDNTAEGDYSFAAGRRAKANHQGAFVWGDSVDADITSTANNQFIVRATGGVAMYTNSQLGQGAQLFPGANAWSAVSDRNAKDNFAPVDGREVLDKVAAMPVQTWNYKSQDATIRHMGPMAQDFYAAFGVGEDEKHISTVDADGVALAAIQGLNQVVAEKEARIANLETQNARLEAQNAAQQRAIDDLQKRMAALDGQATGPALPLTVTMLPGGWGALGFLFAGGVVAWQMRRRERR
ncbi:MAG: tail fiber domain-containing protein [Chloroflexi bacterium]|nr:tail fiber domain-containing protein [Chloroflexota bacterium]